MKLKDTLSDVTPSAFLSVGDGRLKRIGFSRQKAGYCRGLARAILSGELDLAEIARTDDEKARSALLAIKGIGPWTADIYLLTALRRPDIWPTGDLALRVACHERLGLHGQPGPEKMIRLAARWRPWRAVAARMLWHAYLGARGRVATPTVPG